MLQKRKLILLFSIAIALTAFIFLFMFIYNTWLMFSESRELVDFLLYMHSYGFNNNDPIHFVIGPADIGSRCFNCEVVKSTENSEIFFSTSDIVKGTKFDIGSSVKLNKK